VQIFEFEFLVDKSILVSPESKKVVFRIMSVCMYVCMCVGCVQDQSRDYWSDFHEIWYVGNNPLYLQAFFYFFNFLPVNLTQTFLEKYILN
jgi:hypothetical protein